MSLRFVSGWRGAAQLLIVLLVGGAVVVHYGKAATHPSANPPMSVTADRVGVTSDGAHLDVLLRVNAGPQDLGDISVFWIIAPPGVERPWDVPSYVAPEQILKGVPAGATNTVKWIGTPLALPPGSYEVTAWVHQILASGQPIPLAGGAVGTFSVTPSAPATLRLAEGSFRAPSGPLVLEAVSLNQELALTQLAAVEIKVRNRGTSPFGGRTQMVVNRFTDPEPFRTAFWQTDWQVVPVLNPGDATTLSWNTPIGLPAGTYGLSVWLHARIDSDWQHSQATFNIPLNLGPNLSRVQRARPGTSDVRITEASLVDDGRLRLAVDNAGSDVTALAGVEVLSEVRRFDWHLTALVPREALGSFRLTEHSQRMLDLPVQVDCASEARFVHVSLFAAGAPANAAPSDDVLVDACA